MFGGAWRSEAEPWELVSAAATASSTRLRVHVRSRLNVRVVFDHYLCSLILIVRHEREFLLLLLLLLLWLMPLLLLHVLRSVYPEGCTGGNEKCFLGMGKSTRDASVSYIYTYTRLLQLLLLVLVLVLVLLLLLLSTLLHVLFVFVIFVSCVYEAP